MSYTPAKYWRSSRALGAAREAALRLARAHLEERRRIAQSPVAAYQGAHEGFHHLELFRGEFLQTLSLLPAQFHALEIGAGLGWMALLTAARSPEASILATELRFGGEGPHSLPNCFTVYRLAEREPALREVVDFSFDESRTLVAMKLTDRITFAQASATDLPVADESQDFLYSINCLEHLPDLPRCFGEMQRALRPGGILLHTTEPLFFSPYGHHLHDFFPAPWAHLLWERDELASIVAREVGALIEWAPGVPLTAQHIAEEVLPSLNGASPADFRRALRAGPWEILAWMDIEEPRAASLAQEIGLREALRGISWESLVLRGLRMKLRRGTARRHSLRAPFLLPHTVRNRLREILPRRSRN